MEGRNRPASRAEPTKPVAGAESGRPSAAATSPAASHRPAGAWANLKAALGPNSAGPAVFVWGVWGVMLLAALSFAAHHSYTVPVADEWYLVAAPVSGQQPVTPGWVWSQHGEHRLPLARLVGVALFEGTGHFSAGTYYNAVLLGAAAMVLLRVSRRLRGRTAYTDAFFPLVVMHLGYCEHFITGTLYCVAISQVAILLFLALLAAHGARLTPVPGLLAGLGLLLLPLCGAYGLPYTPPLACWLGYAVLRRAHPAPALRWLLLPFALGALVIGGVYLVGYQSDNYNTPSSDIGTTVRAALGLAGCSFGVGVTRLGDWLGPGASAWSLPLWVGLGVWTTVLAAVVVLARVWSVNPAERPRAAGLLLFLASTAALALGTAYFRGGGLEVASVPRYAALVLPALCCLYLVSEVYAPAAGKRVLQVGLLLLAAALIPLNTRAGLEFGRYCQESERAFLADLYSGVPGLLLAELHGDWILGTPRATAELPPEERRHVVEHAVNLFHAARDARLGPFRFLKEMPPFHEEAFPVLPTGFHEVTWKLKSGRGATTGADAHLYFELPRSRWVYALRIEYAQTNPEGASLSVSWATTDPEAPPDAHGSHARFVAARPLGSPVPITVWVNRGIDRIALNPGAFPCVFRIARISLLVPASQEQTVPP